ncbi:MAG: 2-oxo acid dehydrogenase subunit E2 [Sphaerochaetaceae bacterium]|nr:2-oxo acid dehydrogenase subunit E2 [Sphaerochaetaceae bacterium]
MGRKDGKRVKDADPMYVLAPYIMDKRYDAMNMITVDIPLDPLKNYIRAKRQEGKYVSHLGLIIAAYLRTAAQYPLLNRFVVNKKIYDRNAFDVAMVVLKEGDGDMEGTMSKIRFDFNDNVFEVQKKIDEYIEKNKNAKNNNSTDKLIKKLLAFPGLANFGIKVFKWLDKRGLLPMGIIDASPFHTSLTVTNLASIKTNHIYHHVYEFGTTSVFISMGNTREVPVKEKGEVVFKTCLPLGIVMDERICSGHYFASVFSCVKKYLSNPSLMEKSVKEELEGNNGK